MYFLEFGNELNRIKNLKNVTLEKKEEERSISYFVRRYATRRKRIIELF